MALSEFLTVSVVTEILALIASFLCFGKKDARYLCTLPFYLLFVLSIEFLGYYYHSLKRPNYVFYNFLMLIQAIYFCFLFYRFDIEKKGSTIILLLLLAFVITFLLEGINISFSAYNIYSRQALSILVLVLCFRFYYLLLKNDTISFPLNYPPFWIVTGLLVFYLGTVGLFAFYKQVSSIKLSGNNTFYDILMGTFCCILYGSWIIAIICQKKQEQL